MSFIRFRPKKFPRFAVRATLEAVEPRVLFSGLSLGYDATGITSITYNNAQIFGSQNTGGAERTMAPSQWVVGTSTSFTWTRPASTLSGSSTSPTWTYSNFNLGSTGVNATFVTAVTTGETANYDYVNFTFTVTNNQPASDLSNPTKTIQGFNFQLPYMLQPNNGSNWQYSDRQVFQTFQIFNQRDYTQSNGSGGLLTVVNSTAPAGSYGTAAYFANASVTAAANTVVSYPMMTFGTIGQPLNSPLYTSDAILPQQTKTYSLSLRFSADTATADQLAGPELRNYAIAYPSTVNWDDRRAIFQATLSSPSVATSTNPRGWLTAKSGNLDLTTPSTLSTNLDLFYTQMINAIDYNIANALNSNAQGIVVWDIEGGEFPDVHYYGNPDLYSRVPSSFAPEMFYTKSGYSLPLYQQIFREITNAGLRAGVTLRPQDLQFDAASHTLTSVDNWQQTGLSESKIEAAVNYLSNEITWASNPNNLGATLFYIDSLGIDETEIISRLHALHPDVLLMPEHSSGRMYANSIPYAEYRNGYTGVSEAVRVAYPDAASSVRTSETTPTATEIANTAAGDIAIIPANRTELDPYLSAYGTVSGATSIFSGQTYTLNLSAATSLLKGSQKHRTMLGGIWLIDWEGNGNWTTYGGAGQLAPTSVTHTYTNTASIATSYTIRARYYVRGYNAKIDTARTQAAYTAGLTSTGQATAASKTYIETPITLTVQPFSQLPITPPTSSLNGSSPSQPADPGSTPVSTPVSAPITDPAPVNSDPTSPSDSDSTPAPSSNSSGDLNATPPSDSSSGSPSGPSSGSSSGSSSNSSSDSSPGQSDSSSGTPISLTPSDPPASSTPTDSSTTPSTTDPDPTSTPSSDSSSDPTSDPSSDPGAATSPDPTTPTTTPTTPPTTPVSAPDSPVSTPTTPAAPTKPSAAEKKAQAAQAKAAKLAKAAEAKAERQAKAAAAKIARAQQAQARRDAKAQALETRIALKAQKAAVKALPPTYADTSDRAAA